MIHEILTTGNYTGCVSTDVVMRIMQAHFALDELRTHYANLAGYENSRASGAIQYHQDKDGYDNYDKPLAAYKAVQQVCRDFYESPGMTVWYKEAYNFMMFINTLSPEVGVAFINIAIKSGYSLPFSNMKMPQHKAWFAKNRKMFRELNSV